METNKITNYTHQGQRDYQEDNWSIGANSSPDLYKLKKIIKQKQVSIRSKMLKWHEIVIIYEKLQKIYIFLGKVISVI